MAGTEGKPKVKVGINGFGCIGRLVARVALEHENIELIAINDPSITLQYMAETLKYDIAHGQSKDTEVILHSKGYLVVHGNRVALLSFRDPSEIPWSKEGVEFVVESTSVFTDKEKASGHLKGGAKKVVICSHSKDAPMYVMGVNEDMYSNEDVVSMATCTTNCLAPLAKVINDKFEILEGLITILHAKRAPHKIVSRPLNKDWEGGLDTGSNDIPSATEVAQDMGKLLPGLKEKFIGMTFCVPSTDTSIIDLTVTLGKPTSYDSIKTAIKEASEETMKGILGYVEDITMSKDFAEDSRSSIFDAKTGIALSDILVKLILQINNHWGYSNRVLDFILHMSKYKNSGKLLGNNRRKADLLDFSKAWKHLKRFGEFEGVRSKFKGVFVVQRERHHEDLDGKSIDFVPKEYFQIHRGTVVIQDKNSKEVVFVVKFTPFDQMTPDEYEEYQKLTVTLTSVTSGASSVTSNRAQRAGKMYALGWRGGMDKGLSLGRYVPSRQTQRNASSLENWKCQQSEISELSSIFGKKFCSLAPTLFEHTREEATSAQVPTLSETEFNILHNEECAFSSNLTYTMKEFCNTFHRDRDFNSYTFGIWAPICLDSGELATQENGFRSNGGEFVLGSYKAYIDFNACNGVVEVIWRGKTDFHCTIPSTIPSRYTRIGTSLQISDDLVRRMKKLTIMHTEGVDISQRIRGVNEIVDLKLKNVK